MPFSQIETLSGSHPVPGGALASDAVRCSGIQKSVGRKVLAVYIRQRSQLDCQGAVPTGAPAGTFTVPQKKKARFHLRKIAMEAGHCADSFKYESKNG